MTLDEMVEAGWLPHLFTYDDDTLSVGWRLQVAKSPDHCEKCGRELRVIEPEGEAPTYAEALAEMQEAIETDAMLQAQTPKMPPQ